MKIGDILGSAPSSECPLSRTAFLSLRSYPTDIIELLVFHRLHFHMDPGLAVKSYLQLRSEFVDWNEVRISPIREIQEQVSRAENSLELSVFIKDLLEFVHHDKHKVDLEPLAEENLTEIRRYLKQIRNMEPASIDLILLLRKEHPVVPLTNAMDHMLTSLGLLRADDSRDRKEKSLFELVGAENALAFHHLALNYVRSPSFIEDRLYESPDSTLARIAREYGRPRRRSKKTKKGASKGRTTKKKQTKKKTPSRPHARRR